MGKQLYVTNISFQATEEDIWKHFSVAGKVKHIKLLTDPVTGKFKGCGFVEMATLQDAKEAIDTLDDCLVIDRQIKVEEARPPKPRETQYSSADRRKPAPGKRPSGRGRK
ncbi:putative RNA-binding protein RbpA [Geobacter sp. OR-1]|uniref:RNA recognition motif domain-containing protein n=1 Tax=Geobacter sp. OR-1 TaxID=1266765 RepID=UPI0005442612|nr:RNA-binding protein [Geobacter sp. OR-1]GAM09919.1 putative RNA-binding protein RbpA [Geobacter sp. OR-1]